MCPRLHRSAMKESLNEKLKRKLAELPDKPGCYMMRDRWGAIIYVGKALSLKKRVRSYFRRATLRSADPRLKGLIRSVCDIDVMTTRNDAEAVLAEGRLIKDYRPKYNVHFKDDKRFLMLKLDMSQPFPRFVLCRIQRNDGALYFGPYASSASARCVLEFAEKTFGIRRCRTRVPGPDDHKHCINDIVRFCSAPCKGLISREEYGARVEEACAFLRGERPGAFKKIEAEMRDMSEALNFEKAAALRDTLRHLNQAVRQRARMSRTRSADRAYAMEGVLALRKILNLRHAPRLIEVYDVSNVSGTHAVAGVVVAVNGLMQPARYRRFRIKTKDASDDSRMMAEAIERRFVRLLDEKRLIPDLLLVDGGIIQLRAAETALRKLGLTQLPAAGLAKRFEEIHREGSVIKLEPGSPALNLLKRMRDEAHRFALDYHRRLREKKIRESALDDIPGLGGKRKLILLRYFGSVSRIARADVSDIASVPGVGIKTATMIHKALSPPEQHRLHAGSNRR